MSPSKKTSPVDDVAQENIVGNLENGKIVAKKKPIRRNSPKTKQKTKSDSLEELISESILAEEGKNASKKAKNKNWAVFISIFVMLAVIFGSALGFWLIRGNGVVSQQKEVSIESLDQKPVPEKTVKTEEKTQIVQENTAVQEEALKTEEKVAKNEELDKTALPVNVLNGGAATGLAGTIKDILMARGYSRAEAKNALSSNHAGAAVYYAEDKFQKEAENIQTILTEKKIESVLKKAENSEQKSADIVVMLGK